MGILSIGAAHDLPGAVDLTAPGAFVWWYCDLVDAQGDGVVLVTFMGLPFLAGYHEGRERPCDRPGLNFVVYRGGKPTFYLLQEHAHAHANVTLLPQEWLWEFGESRLRLEWKGDDVTLTAALDLEVPGSRERCRVALDVTGPASRIAATDGDPRHHWCPIAPTATGHVTVDTGSDAGWRLEGRAYLDANMSRVPLSQLGLSSWQWGRIAFPERELIFYAMTPESGGPEEPLVLSVRPGQPATVDEKTPFTWGPKRHQRYGLTWNESVTLRCPQGHVVCVKVLHVVEKGPFYLRFLIEARCETTGESGRGFAELVDVARIDRPWQRPFVRMRTHRASGPNSAWVPLFNGPRSGRAMRLLRHWFGVSLAPGAGP